MTAIERDGWGLAAMAKTAMGRDGNRLIAVSATAEARRLLGATAMGRASGGTTAWWVEGLNVGSMVGNLMLEDDSKWLEGLILGAAGRFDGAESRAQERRWGRQR